jgi:hypothetical protein
VLSHEHEYILDDFFGIRRAPHESSHDHGNTTAVAAHQVCKGVLLSRSDGRKERFVAFSGG